MFGLSWSDVRLRLDSCLDSVGLTCKAQVRLMFRLSWSDAGLRLDSCLDSVGLTQGSG
jgi:hypothetical protein